ncbi:MAG: hypothetical protein ABUK01_18320 [Leptospirales bacterium]
MFTFKIYLDQNIWDRIVKNRFSELCINSSEDAKIEYCYSDTTLEEFSRIENDNDRLPYLNALQEKKAKYLNVDNETEISTLQDINPINKYNDYIENRKSYSHIMTNTEDFLFKIISGNEERSFDEIFHSMFSQVRDILKDSMKNVSPLDTEYNHNLSQLYLQAEKQISGLEQMLTESFKNNKLISPTNNAIKNHGFIDRKEFNNIPSENAVQYAWAKTKVFLLNNNIDEFDKIEDFFHSVLSNQPNTKWNWMTKINSLYNYLNYVGYWQDEKLHKKRNYIPSVNDTNHAYYAAFAHLFLTRDSRFFKKLKAVYSYFNIETKVYHYTEKKK